MRKGKIKLIAIIEAPKAVVFYFANERIWKNDKVKKILLKRAEEKGGRVITAPSLELIYRLLHSKKIKQFWKITGVGHRQFLRGHQMKTEEALKLLTGS